MDGIDTESFDQRAAEFVVDIDDGNEIRDEGTENIYNTAGHRIIAEEDPVHSLSINELRYMPLPLINCATMPHTNAITKDFKSYWGWSAAVFSDLSTKGEGDMPLELLQDYYFVVHSMLLSERHNALMRENRQLQKHIELHNPSINGVANGSGYSVASTFSFPLLEGFLKRRCNDLDPDDNINIYQGLKTLIEDPDVSDVVREVLLVIDDLERYDIDILERKMAGIPDLRGKDSFLWLVKEQRNYNIHGEGSTQAIGSVALTLCTLVLFDMISDRTYQENREGITDSIRARSGQPVPHPMWPAAFYPVKRT